MSSKSIGLGLIGAGRIGTFHAETMAKRLHDAKLVAIADPAPGAAEKLAQSLSVPVHTTDVAALINHPDLDAVVIASPARFHTDLVIQACEAGKSVFVEKPMALTIADAERAINAAAKAGVVLQVGFNRRWDLPFAEARKAIEADRIGQPQLLRSLTRDPGPFGADPAKIPQWTIFYETLIHDFDTLNWLNAPAKPVEVFAVADALIRPDAKASGHLDTAVVTIRYDNGALAVAEANFSALYGYDIRGEVFGSKGMVTMGEMDRSSLRLYGASGVSSDTLRSDTERFLQSYTAEFQGFVDAIRSGAATGPTGEDAKMALAVALAAIRSVERNAPVPIEEILAA
ncbi:Gfo/Idh/MocA family oxidoreductase [Paracoccus sp. (in: a-proteobacteria)]|uniref:Gfo/Idh/MocA family oxidoreductase n=1 Tax=Paracoccus sp. TaxID=267 RepID=UPI0035AF322A